jgi:hypothetical protein
MTAGLCSYRTVSFTGSLFYRPVLLTDPISLQLSVGYGTEVTFSTVSLIDLLPYSTVSLTELCLL